MSEYVVIYERADDGGWGAYLPELPGVVVLGSTRDEVSHRIPEAVDGHRNRIGNARETKDVVATRNALDVPAFASEGLDDLLARDRGKPAPAPAPTATRVHARP